MIEDQFDHKYYDTILPNENIRIIIEFKIGSNYYEYEKDVAKLSNQKSNQYSLLKVFCALVDTFDKKPSDERILRIDSLDTTRPILNEFPSLKSINRDYKQDISCTICTWEVL